MHFNYLIVALSSFAAAASALAVQPRDVFAPPVLYPHSGTVWIVGQHHNVTWDISHAPVNITGRFGSVIQLVKSGGITPLVLRQGFDILLSRIEVQVPNVVDGDDYQLMLLGDSGDLSQVFTITS